MEVDIDPVEAADYLCAEFDRLFHAWCNKILEEIKDE